MKTFKTTSVMERISLQAIFALCFSVLIVQQGIAQNRSYIQEEVITVAGVTSATQAAALGNNSKQTTRTYFDGFGRPIQSIAIKASPLQKDIVTPVQYDQAGRQAKSFLPYVSTGNDGGYHSEALNSEQPAFYQNGVTDKVADDASPFAEQVFENSPLQRLMKMGMVGTGFQPVAGQHFKSQSFRSNNPSDQVISWSADAATATGYYAVATLSVEDAVDEQGSETLLFKTVDGQVILKRQLNGQEKLDTYYVYDLSGQISFVVPPKATTAMQVTGNYSLLQTGVDKLIFKYVYDGLGRVVEKTVPAGAVIYIVYDQLSRPLLVQDGNLRAANKWNYIKYDGKGRAVSQGIYTNGSYTARTAMQAYVNGLNYAGVYSEQFNGNAGQGYYSNVVFPISGIEPLAYSYYDTYDLNGDGNPDNSYVLQGLSGEVVATTKIKGMLTGTLMRSVGSGLANVWLSKFYFYDNRGRLIQTLGNNQLNASVSDVSTSVLSFTGKPIISKTVKVATSATSVLSTYTYDHMLRVTSIDQRYNGRPMVRIGTYVYNELGQIVKKNLHGTSSFLQSVDYRYNIRGQLLNINNSTLTADGQTNDDSNDVFGMEIAYDQSVTGLGNTASYNGQVSAVKWMSRDASGTAGNERSYKYTYDQLSRLSDAFYQDKTGGNWNSNGAFDEKGIRYDLNGNILSLKRNAIVGGQISEIDNLGYTYSTNNPNQLQQVTDGVGTTYAALGFRNITGSTGIYGYDANGNMKIDPFKGISTSYNELNKAAVITVLSGNSQYISYTYDAGGALLRKGVYNSGVLLKTTDYSEGFVFENGVLSYFPTPEGRVRFAGGNYVSEYMITDQQGNVRVSFEDNGGTAKVVQENSYYAYGMVMTGSAVATPGDANKNLYNGGSEWQNDFANLPDLMQTFYRNYDAALGRWTAVDPQAELFESLTGYNYANNNPVMFNDPMGDISEGAWKKILGYAFNGVDQMQGLGLYFNGDDEKPIEYSNGRYGYYTTNGTSFFNADYSRVYDSNGFNMGNVHTDWKFNAIDTRTVMTGNTDGFFKENWKDIAFTAIDMVGNFIDKNTTYAISEGYNLTRTTIFVGSLVTTSSTKVLGGVSNVAKIAGKVAPWVGGASIVMDAVREKQINAGHVYQAVVTGLSLIPGAGLIIGGGALLLEGISYYYTGKSVSDNINSHMNNNGVIVDFKK